MYSELFFKLRFYNITTTINARPKVIDSTVLAKFYIKKCLHLKQKKMFGKLSNILGGKMTSLFCIVLVFAAMASNGEYL
jgi:hypothetical protein